MQRSIARPGKAVGRTEQQVVTPIAGAIAGMVFAVLFGFGVTLLSLAMGPPDADVGAWLTTDVQSVRIALAILPFSGIFFLWFIGVSRYRLGEYEDKFIATVFLASGILFLAMVFVVGAVCGAVVTVGARRPAFAGSEAYLLARHIIAQIFGVYALRMAGVFLISQATLWMRTAVMPRWLSIVTYVIALVLLLTFTSSRWIVLVFPAWVFGVSLYILILHLRRSAGGDAAKDSTSG